MTNKKSNYHRDSKNLRKSRSGVSEIIGNLLILAITVSLFTGVLFFVTNMPAPQDQTLSDFSAQTGVSGSNFYMNITHKGGQTLSNASTNIYLFKNNVPTVLSIYTSNSMKEWKIGTVWSYVTNPYNSGMTISLMIVDKTTNNIVWQAVLAGNKTDQNTPPIIGNRGLTPTPVHEGDKVQFYATVTDMENAMDKVEVDASSIGMGTISLTLTTGSIWMSPITTAALSWNGKTVFFTAYDKGGKNATVQATLSVLSTQSGGSNVTGPFDNYPWALLNGTYPPDATGGNAGGIAGTSGTSFYYIRRASDNVITKQFNPNEKVLIEFYSDTVQNLALENTFILTDMSGNTIAPPTSTQAFSYGGIYGTFQKYVLTFDAPASVGEYSLRMKMKDYTGTTINVGDTIKVGTVNYPIFQFYKFNETQNKLILTSTFNHTEIIYMRIITGSVDPSLSTVSISDIEIADFTGKYIIKLILPSDPGYPNTATPVPLGSLYKSSGSSPARVADNDVNGIYTVQIDPKKASQGWWLPRINTYSIKITEFRDSNEDFNNLCTQIAIIAPLTTTDIVTSLGTGSYTWSATGAAWTNSKLVWFKGGERMDQWTRTTIDDPTKSGPIGMALADMTGAGRNDVIVGYQDSTWSVLYFENQKVDGSSWIEHPIAHAFDAYPLTQNAGGVDKGIANEDATVYVSSSGWPVNGPRFLTSADSGNMGGQSPVGPNELVGAITTGDFDHDGVTDVAVSFVHSVVYSDSTSSGGANYQNSWGMFFNRGIRIYWGASPLDTSTILEGTNRWNGQGGNPNIANDDTNPAALDLASGDFNGDGFNDLVAVYEDGTTKVWLNNFDHTAGTLDVRRTEAFSNNSLVTDIPTVPGTTPWNHHNLGSVSIPTPRVKVADLNSDGVPDIVRTSVTADSVYVFYTQVNNKLSFTTTPTSETQIYGTKTGSYTDLNNLAGGTSETLTESGHTVPATGYKNASYPTAKKTGDTTPAVQVVNTTPNNQFETKSDSKVYTIYPTKVMVVGGFNVSASLSSTTIKHVWLNVAYITGASYTGTGDLLYSTDGTNWYATGITRPVAKATVFSPASVDLAVLATNAVDTYTELTTLQLKFTNNMGSGSATRAISFDQLTIDVTYQYPVIDYYQLSWVYTVPTFNAYPSHNLTINASASGGQTYAVDYSNDNSVWVNKIITIAGLTQKNYSYVLPANPGLNYYIRIRNEVNTLSQESVKLTVLNINNSRTPDYPAIVTWDATHLTRIDITDLPVGERITCIALGDFGNNANTGKPDGLLDIVIGTSYVGGAGRNTLYVKMQNPSGGFGTGNPQFVDTSALSSNVGGSTALYDTQAIDIGDFNGDKVSDIVLVIGFAPGRSGGTANTLWLYMNNVNTNQLEFTEQPLNMLNSGESGINVRTGEISLSFLFPIFGVLLIPVAEAAISRKKKK